MLRRRPIRLGLGIAALLCAAHARAASPLAPTRPRARAAPPQNARNRDDAANDSYNFIAGLFDQGFHDQVVGEATRFLERHASHARAALVRYRLGQSLFELGRLKDAEAQLAKLEPPQGDFPFAHEVSFRLAQCLAARDDHAAAAKRFDPIARADHYLAPAAAWHAGEAHFRAGDFAAAAKSYGLAAQGNDAEYARLCLHGLAWSLYKAGQPKLAADALQLFVQRHPQDAAAPEAWFLLGECRLAQDDPREALAAFQKVGGGEWLDDALSASGFACAAQGDSARAAQWFLRLEQAVPDSGLLPEARLHAGIHLHKSGRDDDAAAVLERLLEQPPPALRASACYWRGLIERRRKGPKEALPHFERGLAAKPDDALRQQLALARADALFDAGDFEAAKEAYAKAGGGSEDAAYSSAVAALNSGDHAGAVQRARDVLARFGQGRHAFAARLVLGEALFAQEKWKEAQAAFEEIVAGEPRAAESGDKEAIERRARALSRAGWCAFKSGGFATAARHFMTLARELPQDPRAAEASFMAGRSLLQAGDATAAEAALTASLEQHGKSEWAAAARYDLAQAKRRLKKDDEADALLAQVAKGGGKVDAALARRSALEVAESHAAAGRHSDALKALAHLVRDEQTPLEIRRPALYAQAWSLHELKVDGEARTALLALFATETREAPLEKSLALPALELAATVARACKDAEGANAAARRYLALAPDHERAGEVALVAALALDEADDARGAAELLADALQRLPSRPGRERLLYQRALSLQAAGEGAQANALFAEVAAARGGGSLAAQAAFELGEQAYARGEWDAALDHYAKAAGEGSAVADAALYKSAWARFQQERFDEAAALFARVAERFPDGDLAGESRFLAGESLHRAGKPEPALAALEAFLEQHPKHEQRRNGLFRAGVAAGETGRLDVAFERLSQLQREFPDFELKAEADLWLGRALLAKQRTQDALAKFDAVIQADRGLLAARAHLGRGDALVAQGRHADALSEFLKVALLYDTPAEVASALWGAGQCLETTGDVDKAKARYAELIEKHANAPEARAARQRLAALGAGARGE